VAKTAVHTHSEWDPLREVIVGTARGAQVPRTKDHALRCINYATLSDAEFERIPTGPYPARVLTETEEDLEGICAALGKIGIRVHRPAPADFTEIYRTAHWEVDGFYAYCPRDTILTVGNQAIETPMALRHRQEEARLYRHLIETVRAPRPRLLDPIYDRSVLGKPTLRDDEPVFDAANCLKLGRDIVYLVSNTGNRAGARWLQGHLDGAYRVHTVENVYSFQHVDSTIVPLRPGLVMVSPERIRAENLPPFFRNWDVLYPPEPEPLACDPEWGPASKWIALNCLSLSPELVMVEQSQVSLMRALEGRGLSCLPVQLRHMRTLGGGPHCVTLDLVREGALEDYSC
jgi:glycine amidinotransferase/scyllo-inosamine-4-phosphate amidinotransferase 1